MEIKNVKSKQLSVPNFCCSFWESRWESPIVDDVLSFQEQKHYPTTSLDENSIEFEFQTDRNVDVELRQT